MINTKFRFVFLFLFLLLLASCNLNNTIENTKNNKNNQTHILILKDGREYKGHLIKIMDNKIFFFTNGQEKVFDKNKVKKIQFHKNRKYEETTLIKQIRDKEIQNIWQEAKKWNKQKDIDFVLLFDKVTYTFKDEHTVIIGHKKALKILTEAGKDQSTQYFYYNKLTTNATLKYGITISPKGSVYSIDDEAINDEPSYNSTPHYDFLHRIKFGLKQVDIGSIFVWESQKEVKIDKILNPFSMGSQLTTDYPINNKIVEILYPNSIHIDYSIYKGLIPFNQPKITTSQENGYNKLQFKINDVKQFIVTEESSPSNSVIYPSFFASQRVTWQELSKEYYAKYFLQSPNKVIKQTAKKIIGKEHNKDKQLKLLYDFVNQKIKLVSIPLSSLCYRLTNQNKLLALPSLNSADKSYLFVKLAQSVGIGVDFLFYKNYFGKKIQKDIPSLRQFDSVLIRAPYKNKSIILSFENSNYYFGETSFVINGADILNISASGENLSKLPLLPSSFSHSKTNYNCILKEDNTLVVKRTTKILKTGQSSWRAKRFYSKKDLDKWIKARINSFNNNSILENYKFVNDLNDFSKPIILEENFIVKNFAYKSGKNIILLPIPGFNYSAANVNLPKRLFPFQIGSVYTSDFNLLLTIPQDYKFSFFPEPNKYDNKYFSFTHSINIDNENKTINFTSETIFRKDNIPTTDYKILKEFKEKLAQISKKWILLEKQK